MTVLMHHCHAMWCISVAYAVMRCLYVCYVRVLCQNEQRYLQKNFTVGSHTILVFPYQTGWQYSDGNPPNGGVECRWGMQKSRFWAYMPAVDAATREVLSTWSPVDDGHHLASWHLYRLSYTAGIRPPSATCDKVTVSVVLQRENDQARSRTIHNHNRSHVWQQCLTLCRRQQNRIELFALVNPKLK